MDENTLPEKPDIEEVLFESGRQIALAYAGDRGKTDNIARILEEGAVYASHVIGKMEESMESPPEIACKAGCPYCCSMQISITPPEAIVLGAHVVDHYSEDQQRVLLEKIGHNIRLTYGKSQGEKVRNWHDTPCIFLEGGGCSVYAIRPFVCRSWHSLDAGHCIEAYGSHDKEADIDSLFYINYVYGTVRNGIQEGCKDLGLQWETQIVTSAVKSFLAHHDPAGAWVSGDLVFQPG